MVEYESGYKRCLDSAVRQNVLDGVRSVTQAARDQVGKEFGADGVQISAHSLCALDHLPYQGRIYTNEEFEAINESLDRPFGMWNCRHVWYPVITDIATPTYDEATLKKYADISTEQITIGSKTQSRYDWTQEQRKTETLLRDAEITKLMAENVGDEELANAAGTKIRQLREYYNAISRAAGLIVKNERTNATELKSITDKAIYGFPHFSDVTNEYIKNTQNGIVKRDEGYNDKRHQDEILCAEWLAKKFGGEVTLLKESQEESKLTPDF